MKGGGEAKCKVLCPPGEKYYSIKKHFSANVFSTFFVLRIRDYLNLQFTTERMEKLLEIVMKRGEGK